MCGRYALYGPISRLREQFELEDGFDFPPRYNLAPMQWAPVIRQVEGNNRAGALRWGLLPGWARDPAIASRLINARSETVAERPAFRAAFKARRCVVPASGFFEWQTLARGKQPWFIFRPDHQALALAGLWEHARDPAGELLETFTILTMAANEAMQPLHDRQPVMLDDQAWRLWLAPDTPHELLHTLIRDAADAPLAMHRVDRAVGNVRNDHPGLVDALPEG